MAKIRNQAAYDAAVARNNQMQSQQAQNVSTMQQQGAQGIMDQQQLMQILLQQAAMRQAQAQAVSKKDMPLGVYKEIFSGGNPLPGFNKRKSAYEDLNLGHGDDQI
jgi:hypothetical protein